MNLSIIISTSYITVIYNILSTLGTILTDNANRQRNRVTCLVPWYLLLTLVPSGVKIKGSFDTEFEKSLLYEILKCEQKIWPLVKNPHSLSDPDETW